MLPFARAFVIGFVLGATCDGAAPPSLNDQETGGARWMRLKFERH